MKDILEIRHTDMNGRVGFLYTKHGKVEIPAFIPVVHPVVQELSIDIIKEMGFEIVITNAYITFKRYKDIDSIHKLLNFDKVIMTDSGGYQVLEYGKLDVNYDEIARFEEKIGSDIAVPLDKPTGYMIDREVAEEYVKETLYVAENTLKLISRDDIIWVGPIQGGGYLDLVKLSAKKLDELGYQMFALGSPTEVMETYKFKELASMIISAKSVIPPHKPLHLFGAGNPLTIPLAVALGCDTFDSASYILYAKDDRYMLSNGTVKLKDLTYLPCNCKVCTKYKAKELVELNRKERIIEIAKHNLYTIKREVEFVKQSILEGRLWEYVIQKSLSHPRLYEANEILKYIDPSLTPIYKQRAVFLMTKIDQYRPELVRYRDIVRKARYNSEVLILLPESDERPLYTNKLYNKIKSILRESVIAYYSPFLGIVPEELSDLFPASHYVASKTFRLEDSDIFKESFLSFLINNRFKYVIILTDNPPYFQRIIEDTNIKCKIVNNINELIELIKN